MKLFISEALSEKQLAWGLQYFEATPERTSVTAILDSLKYLLLPGILLPITMGWASLDYITLIESLLSMVCLFGICVMALMAWMEYNYRKNLARPLTMHAMGYLLFSRTNGWMTNQGGIGLAGYACCLITLIQFYVIGWSFFFWFFASFFFVGFAYEILLMDIAIRVLHWIDPHWTGKFSFGIDKDFWRF